MSLEPSNGSLTRGEFRRAMRNGQGRVIQFLRSSPADPFLDIIEHAITHALGYDPQCEGGRDDWVLEIINLVGGLPRFRELILSALRTTDVSYDASQLSGLAVHLVRSGDEEARRVLYESFARRVDSTENGSHVSGGLDIIDLDAHAGLKFVAKTYGRRCRADATYQPDDFRWFTNEVFAEYGIDAALKDMAAEDEDIREFFERLRKDEVESVIRSAETPGESELARMSFAKFMVTQPDWIKFFEWGRVASEGAIREAAEYFRASLHEEQATNVLCAFAFRSWPLDDSILLDALARSNDEPRRVVYLERALKLRDSCQVRAAGLAYLKQLATVARGISLLCASAQAGDADAIMQVVNRIDPDADIDLIHDVVSALLDFFDDDRMAEGTEALLWVYEHSPCSICRSVAIDRLDQIALLPEWIVDEAQYDCSDRIRDFILGEDEDEHEAAGPQN